MTEAVFPDIHGGEIAIDSETKDEGLKKGVGAGWAWPGGGRVLGFSVFTPNFSEYYSFGQGKVHQALINLSQFHLDIVEDRVY